MAYSRIVGLTKQHDRTQFDCGAEELNAWIRRTSRQNDVRNNSRTYVSCLDHTNVIVGFYTITMSSVEPEAAQKFQRSARDAVPVILLARLGVQQGEQKNGLGSALLQHASILACRASEILGGAALILHPKDAKVRRWYMNFGFAESSIEDGMLYMEINTLRANLVAAGLL